MFKGLAQWYSHNGPSIDTPQVVKDLTRATGKECCKMPAKTANPTKDYLGFYYMTW